MRRGVLTFVVAWAAGCGTSSNNPHLTAIVPSTVTTLVATPAVISGVDLDATVKLDLDHRGSANVDRAWSVAIDGVPIDATQWIDPQTLDITIPRGLAVGVHDVAASSPDGRQLVLPQALTVTGEPVGLVLAVEDAPGGAGHPVSGTFGAGSQITAYAVVRDAQQMFVSDVSVDWATTAPIGTLGAPTGSSVTLSATRIGTGALSAHEVGAALDAQSGAIVVIAGAATHIAIEDAPGGTGTAIGARTGLTTDSNGGFTAYAVARDAYENFAADAAAAWALTGVTGTVPTSSVASAAVLFSTPGVGVLHATDPAVGSAATGSLTVSAGRAATLTIAPSTLTIAAGAAPAPFTATAVDSHGNPTTNLGTLTWSIGSGPITSIDPITGSLTPFTAGTGTVAVASSLGPTAQSGAVTIVPGAPASVVVMPSMLMATSGASPTTFTAAVSDAEGNTTSPGTLTWSVASGPITAIAASTGVFTPTRAGVGTIAATTSNGKTGTAMVTVVPGHAAALAISPTTLVTSQGGAGVPFSVTGSDAAGNATTDLGTIAWAIASGPIAAIDATTGVLTPTTPGTGSIKATSSYGPSATTGSIQILAAAALTASLTVPTQVSVGQTFSVAMKVTNTGQDAASNVTACTLAISGTGAATIVTTPPAVATLAGGANTTMTWMVTATAAGSLGFSTCANATDAVTNAAISANASGSSTALVPPQLAATLTVPSLIGRGTTFTVTMTVTNSGQVAANGVAPSTLTASGTGAATLQTSPTGSSTIGPGGSAQFQWTYQATAVGTLQLQGTASGTDAIAGNTVTTPSASSNQASIVEAYTVATDPFGDGTAFAFVAGYHGEVYLGPSKAGTLAYHINPDETGAATQTCSFSRDTGSDPTSNTASPYTSIGAASCTTNTTACGPDNENLRGLFASTVWNGTEWLLQSGAKSALGASFVYGTTATTSPLAFIYADLGAIVSAANSYGPSAIGTVGKTLYVGTSGSGAGAAQLIAVTTQPSSPGLDATTTDAQDMTLQNLGAWANGASPVNVDVITSVGGLVYTANKNAWVRADVLSPVPMPNTCLLCCLLGCTIDWIDITPTATAYTAKTSVATTKLGGLEPRDRAVPQIVTFGGHIFAARNTTAGPQLWSCNPTSSKCNAADWALVAPNATGDAQLTQFDDTGLTSITLLAATSTYLYVGFDSASGLQIFRTANAAAAARSDFEGQNGCSAANHPATCVGYGGAGVGSATNTRIFDGKALTLGASTAVWLTVGNDSAALALVTLP